MESRSTEDISHAAPIGDGRDESVRSTRHTKEKEGDAYGELERQTTRKKSALFLKHRPISKTTNSQACHHSCTLAHDVNHTRFLCMCPLSLCVCVFCVCASCLGPCALRFPLLPGLTGRGKAIKVGQWATPPPHKRRKAKHTQQQPDTDRHIGEQKYTNTQPMYVVHRHHSNACVQCRCGGCELVPPCAPPCRARCVKSEQ